MKKPVFVCGGGHQGLAMAGYLALNGETVHLWNRTQENIQAVLDTGVVSCDGVIEGVGRVARASTDLSELVSDLILVTTPSTAHQDIARRLAPFMTKDKLVVLNPGRTFGAVEFLETLKHCGVTELPTVAETQTIVFTCRRSASNNATIFALKNGVRIAAAAGADVLRVVERLPACLRPYFSPVSSLALTSLTNVGMVLHCAPVLMNIGWIETDTVDFKYYYDGISPSVARFLEKIDAERVAAARALGYEIESLVDWLRRSYGVTGNTILDCIRENRAYREIDAPPTIKTRYLLEDVPNGLVPIEFLASRLGVPTPNITTIVNLANAVLERDFRVSGRRFPPDILKQYMELPALAETKGDVHA